MTTTDTALLEALAQNAAFDGWTHKALRAALSSLGREPEEVPLVFSGGAGDMIEAYVGSLDERMLAAVPSVEGGLTARVRGVIATRLALARGEKEAIRRALAVLALPQNAIRTARITARTVDAIWFAAGDRSADFSWYTKRATLAAVYGATLLYWLTDTSEGDANTLAFLDRRLAGVGAFTKLRQGLKDKLPRPRLFREKTAEA
jgi:ubiquinone biosynthesis protein COQ9